MLVKKSIYKMMMGCLIVFFHFTALGVEIGVPNPNAKVGGNFSMNLNQKETMLNICDIQKKKMRVQFNLAMENVKS